MSPQTLSTLDGVDYIDEYILYRVGHSSAWPFYANLELKHPGMWRITEPVEGAPKKTEASIPISVRLA